MQLPILPNKLSRNKILIEITAWSIGIVILIYLLHSMLISGETTMAHESFVVRYPVFHFFTESIIGNVLPLWNPFTHGGEPFWPLLINMNLMGINFLSVIFLKYLTNNPVFIFNWSYIIRNILMLLGVYLVLRQFTKHLYIRITLIPILLFSSFMVATFRSPAFASHFFSVPFVTFFFLRIIYFNDNRWHNWLCLAAFIGLSLQGNLFGSVAIFLFLFILGVIFFRRDYILYICLKLW